MYTCDICGKHLKQAGSHPATHTSRGKMAWNKGKHGHYAPETLIKMSISQKERFKRMPTPNKGIPHSEETKRKISRAKIGIPCRISEENMKIRSQKMSERQKGKPQPEHVRKLLAEYSRARMADPILRRKQLSKMMAGYRNRPTSLEKIFIALCVKHNLPFRYVGNGEVWIVRKNPDFININGKKQLVEILGNYWHKEIDVQELIKHYSKYGFECITIWEDELKDENLVLEKIGYHKEVRR